MNKFNYIKISTFSPKVAIANPIKNVEEILKLIKENINSDIFLFPELSVSGYSCGDLFFDDNLLYNVELALCEIHNEIRLSSYGNENIYDEKCIVIGAPLRKGNCLFDCAVVFNNYGICGVVPKRYISNIRKESKYFQSGINIKNDTIHLSFGTFKFGEDLLFKINTEAKDVVFGIEFGEEMYAPNSPITKYIMQGANLILNLAADTMEVNKKEIRINTIVNNSKRNICAYAYSSAGSTESTTDVVYSGHKIISCIGNLINENEKESLTTIVDLNNIYHIRRKNQHLFYNNFNSKDNIVLCYDYKINTCDDKQQMTLLYEKIKNENINPYPFLPNTSEEYKYYEEILDIQTLGLFQRLNKTNIKKIVLGVSGGLDSTLALLIAYRVMNMKATNENEINNYIKDIIGITMPGFGTTSLTKNNSIKLMEILGITTKTIPIVDACLQHFKDIKHNENCYDITYENVQARERTQILMDFANKENGLVVGTGDMSELALGWCTYNGDHMSMYSLNANIPKTLIKALILHIADDYKNKGNIEISNILYDICETPISPELLPTDKDGNMVQTTEKTIGKYDLHDFFMYYMLGKGYSPSHIFILAKIAFNKFIDIDDETILKTMETFYNRFFSQQFKRSCMPDGPSVFDIGFSPRISWFMPSDANKEIWLEEIQKLKGYYI